MRKASFDMEWNCVSFHAVENYQKEAKYVFFKIYSSLFPFDLL